MVGVVAFVAEFAADVGVHRGGEAADDIRERGVKLRAQLAAVAVLAGHAGIEAAENFSLLAQEHLAEK